MATRSTIAMESIDGTVKQIYCHFDGDLDHNGRILKEFYTAPELVRELISGGDLSILAESINPRGAHSFDAPELNCCVYYNRDRGESWVIPREFSSFEDFKNNLTIMDYNYVYREADDRWYLIFRGELKEYFVPDNHDYQLDDYESSFEETDF